MIEQLIKTQIQEERQRAAEISTGGGSGGRPALVVVNTAINYSAATTDDIVFVSGGATVTVPAFASFTNFLTVENAGIVTATVAAQSGETINGRASWRLRPKDSVTMMANSSEVKVV
jgi:hypothetical protein